MRLVVGGALAVGSLSRRGRPSHKGGPCFTCRPRFTCGPRFRVGGATPRRWRTRSASPSNAARRSRNAALSCYRGCATTTKSHPSADIAPHVLPGLHGWDWQRCNAPQPADPLLGAGLGHENRPARRFAQFAYLLATLPARPNSKVIPDSVAVTNAGDPALPRTPRFDVSLWLDPRA